MHQKPISKTRFMLSLITVNPESKLPHLRCNPLTVLLGLCWLSGCASSEHGLTLAPVGPAPTSINASTTEGSLLVYSAFQTTADFNRTPYRRQYTDYRILSSDGHEVLQMVHNDNGLLINGPKQVALAVGEYRVVARANGYGTVNVPVVIRAGQSTIVHLEGSVWWPKSSGVYESDPVRLPKGEIVGWPAHPPRSS